MITLSPISLNGHVQTFDKVLNSSVDRRLQQVILD